MTNAETAATLARKALPSKRISYSNEDFDVTSRIARELTDADRAAKVPDAPACGYSGANWTIAEQAVRSWLRP